MNACYCYLVVEAAVQNAAGIVETNENYKVDIPAVEAEEKKVEPTALEKFWKAVRDNPSDFTGWTYLLQYVEQQVRPYTCFVPSTVDRHMSSTDPFDTNLQ